MRTTTVLLFFAFSLSTSAFADVSSQIYALNQGQPIWTGSQANDTRLQALKQFIPQIARHGLHSGDYDFASIFSSQNRSNGWAFDQRVTAEVLKVIEDLSIGRIDPTTVPGVHFNRRAFTNVEGAYQFLMNITMPAFDQLAPQHEKYKNLVTTLSKLRRINTRGGFRAIPRANITLKSGVDHPLVREIKLRLNAIGFTLNETTLFDASLTEAIQEIQKSIGVEASGELNSTTTGLWDYFSKSSYAQQIQVEISMEKLRWLPEDLGERHIFINIANQELRVVDPEISTNSPIRVKKVIVGKPTTPTPSQATRVKNIVLNPKWRAPTSIIKGEMIGAMVSAYKRAGVEGVDSYLRRNNYRLVSSAGDEIDASSINWKTVTPSSYSFMVVQDSGPDNSLGVVKINLDDPNNLSVYMHDTPGRGLFARLRRLFSHGCIRIERPLELAAYLLEGSHEAMTQPELEGAVSTPTETKNEQYISVAPERRLPVYMMPLTVFIKNHHPQFTYDVYNQDQAVLMALKAKGYYRLPSANLNNN